MMDLLTKSNSSLPLSSLWTHLPLFRLLSLILTIPIIQAIIFILHIVKISIAHAPIMKKLHLEDIEALFDSKPMKYHNLNTCSTTSFFMSLTFSLNYSNIISILHLVFLSFYKFKGTQIYQHLILKYYYIYSHIRTVWMN